MDKYRTMLKQTSFTTEHCVTELLTFMGKKIVLMVVLLHQSIQDTRNLVKFKENAVSLS